MELRHLRYFCAVAEERHVTRAAERLRVAQPALTQQIRALETELRAPLLRRAGRGIELTEAGIAFWREAEAILGRVRVATLITQETARGQAGRLMIGLTETASFASPSPPC
jgi:DNA-binding transcriptional LysR family regulator